MPEPGRDEPMKSTGVESDRAFLEALKILKRRDYFTAELQRRLERKDFSPEAVGRAVARCSEMRYLDDRRLAARFAQLRGPARGWGPNRIRAELIARGVEESIAGEASRISGEVFEAALGTALRRAENRARAGWWATGEGRARMVSSLIRRGFEPEEARRAVEGRAAIREADDETDDQPGDPAGIS